MQKDVIYIDVEDDITAIIGKVKAGQQKIVALVPPKRIGVLQSAVNLRLLARAASGSNKQLVLISNNSALQSLAAAAKIPVAKNLQSKPELGEIAALDVDDGDDIIDGAQLPIGEHAKMAEASPAVPAAAAAAAASVLDDAPAEASDELEKAAPPRPGATPVKPRVKGGTKIPNFSKFRKKILIGVIALVILIPALVWAIFFAPHATIYISAKTTENSLKDTVALSTSATTSSDQNTLRATQQQVQKSISQTFTATGTKDAGTKATGTAKLSTQDIDNLGMTIPAGTVLTANGGSTFTTDSAVTFTLQNYKGTNVGITATANGDSYNGATGPLAGAPNGVSASVAQTTAGGTSKTITVVTADDIAKAQAAVVSQNTDALRAQVSKQFDKNVTIIKDSFVISTDGISASPAQDQEASGGQATLTGTLSATMIGVAPSELKSYLDGGFNEIANQQPNQRVYDNGSAHATFSDVQKTDNGFSATLTANGKIGPKIDDAQIKKAAEGKRFGDVQSSLSSIQGVRNVDVKFSPFWVSTVPNDPNRITIQFKLDGSN